MAGWHSLTPSPTTPFHSFSGFSLYRPGQHKSPTPSLRRGPAEASAWTHPTEQLFQMPGFTWLWLLSHSHFGLGLGETVTLLPGKNCTGQIARGFPWEHQYQGERQALHGPPHPPMAQRRPKIPLLFLNRGTASHQGSWGGSFPQASALRSNSVARATHWPQSLSLLILPGQNSRVACVGMSGSLS